MTANPPAGQSTNPSTDSTSLQEHINSKFGSSIADSHAFDEELWVRVHRDSWADMASWLKDDHNFKFFNFLSAIDWMNSPFGRDMDSTVDNTLSTLDAGTQTQVDNETHNDTSPSSHMATPIETGITGGDTRFQLLARINNVHSHHSIILKADLPDEDLKAPSWVSIYPGANWHEREAWEMFGINFDGHPGLRHLYLPGEFEGNPMRKDYPLLARQIKPWPGIVDVELIPDNN
ncbi:MAG: NADH-quinone oxidoreductase subunit C [Acidimicrobiaceae bacterium]|nr:NADH-quinone oxidoreductase subunit C [Acidimicrobiaceae bacterium]